MKNFILVLGAIFSLTAQAGGLPTVSGPTATFGAGGSTAGLDSFQCAPTDLTCFVIKTRYTGAMGANSAYNFYKAGAVAKVPANKSWRIVRSCVNLAAANSGPGQFFASSTSFADNAGSASIVSPRLEYGAINIAGHLVSTASTWYCTSDTMEFSQNEYVGWNSAQAAQQEIIAWVKQY